METRFHVYVLAFFSMELIASVTARRSSVVDNDNFLALRFVLMILIGDSFIAAGVIIVWYPTCLLLIVCITCYKCINNKNKWGEMPIIIMI